MCGLPGWALAAKSLIWAFSLVSAWLTSMIWVIQGLTFRLEIILRSLSRHSLVFSRVARWQICRLVLKATIPFSSNSDWV